MKILKGRDVSITDQHPDYAMKDGNPLWIEIDGTRWYHGDGYMVAWKSMRNAEIKAKSDERDLVDAQNLYVEAVREGAKSVTALQSKIRELRKRLNNVKDSMKGYK